MRSSVILLLMLVFLPPCYAQLSLRISPPSTTLPAHFANYFSGISFFVNLDCNASNAGTFTDEVTFEVQVSGTTKLDGPFPDGSPFVMRQGGFDQSKGLNFTFSYLRGYNNGSILIRQIGYSPGADPCGGSPQAVPLKATHTYGYMGSTVGIHDYARIESGAPLVISPLTGDPSPDCRPRQPSGYCPPRYFADFLLAEGSHAREVAISWSVTLQGRTGNFPLHSVNFGDELSVPGPFLLPQNEQWLRDSNGNIQGVVQVDITDDSRPPIVHTAQLLIGVQAPPGKPTLRVQERGLNAADLTYFADGATSYKIYYGGTSGVYGPSTVNVGTQTSYTLTGLYPFRPYYIAVKGINAQGESVYSNEVVVHPRPIFDLSTPYRVPFGLIAGCLLPAENLVLWLPFDEAEGNVVANASVFSDHPGEKKGLPSSVPGRVGRSLCLNGTSDYVEIPSYPEIDFGVHDFSLEAWVKPGTGDSVSVLVDKRDERIFSSGAVSGYSFFLYNGRLGLQLADGNYDNFIANAVVPADGTWHYVAVTVQRSSKTGVQFYLDGQPVDKAFDPTGHPGSLSAIKPLRIGSRSSSVSGLFHGCLDEVQAFEQAISPDEVLSHFQAGSKGTCK
jgi:hypothetical protein